MSDVGSAEWLMDRILLEKLKSEHWHKIIVDPLNDEQRQKLRETVSAVQLPASDKEKFRSVLRYAADGHAINEHDDGVYHEIMFYGSDDWDHDLRVN